MSHVIVAITLLIPSIILIESFLGFLGFAVKPPMICWGLMLQRRQTSRYLGSYPWILSPVGVVLLTVIALQHARRRAARRDRPLLATEAMTRQTRVASETASTSVDSPQPARRAQARRHLQGRGGTVEAVRDVSLPGRPRRDARASSASRGSGKSVTARAIMRLLPARDVSPRRPDHARRHAHRPAQRAADARDARQPRLDDLPGADVVAEPGLPHRQPDRRGHHACTTASHEARPGRARSTC